MATTKTFGSSRIPTPSSVRRSTSKSTAPDKHSESIRNTAEEKTRPREPEPSCERNAGKFRRDDVKEHEGYRFRRQHSTGVETENNAQRRGGLGSFGVSRSRSCSAGNRNHERSSASNTMVDNFWANILENQYLNDRMERLFAVYKRLERGKMENAGSAADEIIRKQEVNATSIDTPTTVGLKKSKTRHLQKFREIISRKETSQIENKERLETLELNRGGRPWKKEPETDRQSQVGSKLPGPVQGCFIPTSNVRIGKFVAPKMTASRSRSCSGMGERRTEGRTNGMAELVSNASGKKSLFPRVKYEVRDRRDVPFENFGSSGKKNDVGVSRRLEPDKNSHSFDRQLSESFMEDRQAYSNIMLYGSPRRKEERERRPSPSLSRRLASRNNSTPDDLDKYSSVSFVEHRRNPSRNTSTPDNLDKFASMSPVRHRRNTNRNNSTPDNLDKYSSLLPLRHRRNTSRNSSTPASNSGKYSPESPQRHRRSTSFTNEVSTSSSSNEVSPVLVRDSKSRSSSTRRRTGNPTINDGSSLKTSVAPLNVSTGRRSKRRRVPFVAADIIRFPPEVGGMPFGGQGAGCNSSDSGSEMMPYFESTSSLDRVLRRQNRQSGDIGTEEGTILYGNDHLWYANAVGGHRSGHPDLERVILPPGLDRIVRNLIQQNQQLRVG